MQYVKVIGNSHAEAMRKLRDTYGPEAIIYYEKEVPAKTVMSRMMGKKQFMIQAALAEKKAKPKKPSVILPKKETTEVPVTVSLEKDLHAGQEFLNLLDQSTIFDTAKEDFNLEDISFEKQLIAPQRAKLADQSKEKKSLKKGPDTLKQNSVLAPENAIHEIKQDIDAINKKISILIKNPHESQPPKDDFGQLELSLIDQLFSEKWRAGFLENLKSVLPPGEWKIPEKVYSRALEMLSARIKVNPRIGSGRVIALLGATGVGKTTTLAKLASRLKLKEKKRVTLITLDNFRIAATEQLKVYADILDVPIHVTKDPQKFHRILAEDPADVILVDTSGASQNNREFLLKQKEFFPDGRSEIEKHLVLSATSKVSDAKDVLRTFDIFGIDRIVLSKMDESHQFGNFIELAEERNKPFSFFTNGQKVPDDYKDASAEYLAKMVLDPEGEWTFK